MNKYDWKRRKQDADRQKDLEFLRWVRESKLEELVAKGENLLKTKSFPTWKKIALQRAVERGLSREPEIEKLE